VWIEAAYRFLLRAKHNTAWTGSIKAEAIAGTVPFQKTLKEAQLMAHITQMVMADDHVAGCAARGVKRVS
jgi:hypothetical protein